MIERLRVLLDRPLEPATARTVVALALGVGVGFAIVVSLAGLGHRPGPGPAIHRVVEAPRRHGAVRPGRQATFIPEQDPQDRPGTAAHDRAARELRGHRALQHVPISAGGVSVELIGARGGRAVLRVRAATKTEARRGWTTFLRRFGDGGEDYIPRLEAAGH